MTARTVGSLASLALLVIFLLGCETATKISNINREPARYAGKEVTVSGRVTSSFSVLAEGAFEVDDGTGRLWVLSGFGVPGKGGRVRVTGRVESGVSFGGRSFGTVLRETQRHHGG